jgi:hypothetical protein
MELSPSKKRRIKMEWSKAVNQLVDLFEDDSIPVDTRQSMFQDIEFWLTKTVFPSLLKQVIDQTAKTVRAHKLAYVRKH